MLLEALVACTGVTLRAVATAFELHGGRVLAEGHLDFRGTLIRSNRFGLIGESVSKYLI
jgi:hypothetical protein